MSILAKSYQGISGGMNQAVPQHEIPDNMASYMQDVILNTPGIVNRRGPLKKINGSTGLPAVTLSQRATGIVGTQDPTGVYVVAVVAGTASVGDLWLYDPDLQGAHAYAMTTDGTTAFTLDPAVPRYVVDAKPALGSGTFIGVANSPLASPSAKAILMLWRGSTYAGGNVSNVTATVGSAAVTCAAGNFSVLSPGTFMFTAAGDYVGTVQSIQSSTALTLTSAALLGIANATANFQPVKPVVPHAMKGRISIVPNSPVVRGTQGPQGTKFVSQGLNSGTWRLYRLADDQYIGTVNAVTDNATLTILSNNLPAASKGMTNERYYAVQTVSAKPYSVVSGNTVGFLNTVWNGRQWYANRPATANPAFDQSSRIWFSDEADPEGLDLSPDGDWISVQSAGGVNTPITAIQGIPAGLLIFKESELFMLTGTDYTNFAVQKVADAGCLSTSSVVPVGAGCIWASRVGILYFDGRSIKPLSAALSDYWTQSIKPFNTATDRMGAFLWKNHYVLYIDRFASTASITKAASVTTPTTVTFAINLDSFAVVTWTNVAIKGSQQFPAGSGFPTLFVVDNGGTPGTTYICDSSALLDTAQFGADQITCGGQVIGPDFYVETKKYDMGDPERKKLFKQIAMNYMLTGDVLKMDTVPGLNAVGTPINTTWATQSTFANLRKKFTKRDTHMQLRFYQNSAAVTDVAIGPFAIGFKLQRVGRV